MNGQIIDTDVGGGDDNGMDVWTLRYKPTLTLVWW
jgi:hypothetical protein